MLYFTVTNDLVYDQRMIRICTTLANAGYKVMLIGRKKGASIALSPRIFQQKRLNCWFEKGKFFYLEYNIRLFFFLLFKRFDAICSIDLDTLLAGYLVGKLKRKPIIYDAHEYFTELPEVVSRPFTKKVWETLANFIIPKLKHCYTVSQSLADELTQKYNVHFELIRNFPYGNISQESVEKHDPKIILYQGVLNEGRGLEEVIEAMQQIEGAELWLVGEGDLSTALRQQVIILKLENKVKFLGYLPPESLQRLTPKAYIGLNVLRFQGLNYYFSLANKALDYVQAGIPAIHMNFPEYQDLNATHEIGILIDDLEVSKLAQAIQKLLNDEHFYNQIAVNCTKAAKTWTWEKESQKLVHFYNNIIQSTNHPIY